MIITTNITEHETATVKILAVNSNVSVKTFGIGFRNAFYDLLTSFSLLYSELPIPQLMMMMLASLMILLEGISVITYQLYASDNDNDNNDNDDDNCSITNVILGTRAYTKGTKCDDIIVGAPITAVSGGTGSIVGDTLRGLERHDVLQGSDGDDKLYGDEGNDDLTGSDGNDQLYAGPGNDVLQAGVGADLLVGGRGNDELYAGSNDDVLIGGPGTNYFDCGEGNDVLIDFNPARGDTQANNCEVVLTDVGDKEFYSQEGIVKSKMQAFGIGSIRDPIDLEEIGEEID
jgi:RTX calcium-binding nonapeptide repeat (4 copies)